ncbi:MAG TPA: methyltransferase, TIGR04325 family [Candidatus Paceibacterota bacterium]|nr:methyltransferase, TIGR04325 family [Candidatus Paceibacterota bacterium]
MSLKTTLKAWVPPALLSLFKKPAAYGFFGTYPDWKSALADSSGYDSPHILEKVKQALLTVKRGEAAYERDSVVFDTIQYSWPVLASLLWIAAQRTSRLRVLDFGGSLGSSYFQNRAFLKPLTELAWNVVEQETFVDAGNATFTDDHLSFFSTIDACVQTHPIDVFFASSSIQYIENPYALLEEVAARDFPFVLFDRTAVLPNTDRLTVQKVRPGIYDASYPAWFLNEQKVLSILNKKYTLITDFESLRSTIRLSDTIALEKGYLFKHV